MSPARPNKEMFAKLLSQPTKLRPLRLHSCSKYNLFHYSEIRRTTTTKIEHHLTIPNLIEILQKEDNYRQPSYSLNTLIQKLDPKERPSSQQLIWLLEYFQNIILDDFSSTASHNLIDFLSASIFEQKNPYKVSEIKKIIEILLPNQKPSENSLLFINNLGRNIFLLLKKSDNSKYTQCGTKNAGIFLNLEDYLLLMKYLNPLLKFERIQSLFHAFHRLVCIEFTCYRHAIENGDLNFQCPCGNKLSYLTNPEDPMVRNVTSYLETYSNKKVASNIRRLMAMSSSYNPLNSNQDVDSIDKLIDVDPDSLRFIERIKKSKGEFTPSLLCRFMEIGKIISDEKKRDFFLYTCAFRYIQQTSFYKYHSGSSLDPVQLQIDSLTPLYQDPYITSDEVISALKVLPLCTSKQYEYEGHIFHLVSFFTDYLVHLYRCGHYLSPSQIIAVCEAISLMSSKPTQVGNILRILAEHIKMKQFDFASFTANDVAQSMFHLRNMSSDARSLRYVFDSFTIILAHLNSDNQFYMTAKELSFILKGLSNSNPSFPDITSLIFEANTAFLRHTVHEKDELYLLLRDISQFGSASAGIRSLVNTIRLKLENNWSPNPERIWEGVRSLKRMGAEHEEVRMLLSYLTKELTLYPIPNPKEDFLFFMGHFASLDWKYPEVREFLRAILSVAKSRPHWFNIPRNTRTTALALYAMHRSNPTYPEYDKIMTILLPSIQRMVTSEIPMEHISLSLYGLAAELADNEQFQFHGSSLAILQCLLTYLQQVELPPHDDQLISPHLCSSPRILDRNFRKLLSELDDFIVNYGSMLRALLLFSFYSKKHQQLPSNICDIVDSLGDRYASIFEKAWQNEQKLLMMERSLQQSLLIEETDKMEETLAPSLMKALQSRYPNTSVSLRTNIFLHGFELDILFQISVPPEDQEKFGIKKQEGMVDCYINFEVDGPKHTGAVKQKWGKRRDEYITETFNIHVHRISVENYGLLKMRYPDDYYKRMALIELNNFFRKFEPK